MNQQELQRTRHLLQKRFQSIQTASTGTFEQTCQQVLGWLTSHPIFSALLQHLDNVPGHHRDEIDYLLNLQPADFYAIQKYYSISVGNRQDLRLPTDPDLKGLTSQTIEEHASVCLRILRAAATRPEIDFYSLLAIYLTKEYYDHRYENYERIVVDIIKTKAAKALYEYLDEHLDGINAASGLLQKYKQNVEWFERRLLRDIAEDPNETHGSERALARHLQHYIFNQGVEFFIEPSSASGEVDLLLRNSDGGYVIIDAKYIGANVPPSKIIRQLAGGFNQVKIYCSDHNQAEGFLIVFVNADISIDIKLEQDNSFSYLKIGEYIIYYVEINISDRLSASKLGKAKIISIARDKLTKAIQNPDISELELDQPGS